MSGEGIEKQSVTRSLISTVRGDAFALNLSKLFESKQVLNNLEILSQRTCQVNMDTVSYRTLHHWDSQGLIECGRDSSKSGWRKFNLIEALWLHVIVRFRDLGISLEKIANAKTYFFEEIPKAELKYIEYYIVAALYFKKPIFFVLCSGGTSELLLYDEMTCAIEVGFLDYAVIIHLNPLLNTIFKKIEVKSDFAFKRQVSEEQDKICDILDFEDFDSLRITKANGKISDAELEKGFSGKVSYQDVLQEETDVVISTRLSKGVVASRKRTKRLKFE